MNSATTRPRLWRWIFGTLFIVTTWQVLGLGLTFLLASFFDLDVELLFSTADKDLAAIRALPAWSSAATVLISFLPLLLATLLAYRIFLKRNIRASLLAAINTHIKGHGLALHPLP